MLKLPKGLKKKKKGKKSKKDKELFTEEELEQYKREHQQHREEGESATTSDAEHKPTTAEEKTGEDDEWQKFKQLTAGVDSILHKTQDDLDRIKSTSFFKRVLPPSEKKKVEEKEEAAREAEKLEEEKLRKEEEEANRDILAEAVVELSESEEESEEADDIFDTGYIDAITSGEVQLAIVPDSPDLEVDDGPDPFDTSYADKLIRGPEVSKRGKKLVNIGSAVEVLTGRVETVQTTPLAKRKPRRGPQNLLLDDFDEAAAVADIVGEATTPEPPKTLLDDPADDIPDVPIDLSVSLHLTLLKEQQEKKETNESETTNEEKPVDVIDEFDVLKDDDDEFAELAAESLAKKDEVIVLTEPQPLEFKGEVVSDWAEFEFQPEEEQVDKSIKAKPARPPPPPAAAGVVSHKQDNEDESDDEFKIPEDDPFDTTFVENVLPVKSALEDDDFDPRAEETQSEPKQLEVVERDLLGGSNQDLTAVDLSVNLAPQLQKDLLGGSTSDLTTLGVEPIAPVQKTAESGEEDFDPFDTSAVTSLVQPKETELKFLEKELLSDAKLKHSLSDPDFDPRAEEEKEKKSIQSQPSQEADFDSARRKSSLSLNIPQKSVAFLVPQPDLLGSNHEGGKIQKPLTPYYCKENTIEETEPEDPFDTSFVPESKPTEVELNLLEKDLLASTKLSHSLSDPDFDPRADDIQPEKDEAIVKPDLLSTNDNIDIKVLTPAQEIREIVEPEISYADPFDTSIALNIKPGKAELKLIENELLPAKTPEIQTGVLDTLTDAQELGLGDKVLTPQVPLATNASLEEIDPFDTSFANNLGPGKTEIKILENELIEH